MFDIEKELREMIVNIVRDYNEQLLLFICEKIKKDEDIFIKKYLHPYYYMPVIERDLKVLNI
uniref:Uncharacterized protein n=1 Tax=Pyramimonas orientalis virus TaxID=455367 RepID=A0A7M3UNV2_POV01|nr:hypothetical protein HWQ62_00254 [Pyramimonas orientalis virus]